MKRLMPILLLLIGLNSIAQTYRFNPSIQVPINKPMGMGQSGNLDGRSYLWDSANFRSRPFVSKAEVLYYLYLPKFREGNFSIWINEGGVLANGRVTGGRNFEYYFKDNCTNDTCLVLKQDTSSGGSPNTNIGSGYRIAVDSTNLVKTVFPDYGVLIDSTTNENGITYILDSATVFPDIRATIPGAVVNLDSSRTDTSFTITNTAGTGSVIYPADTTLAGAYPASDKKKVNRLVPFSNYDELRGMDISEDTSIVYQDAKGDLYRYNPEDISVDDTVVNIVSQNGRVLQRVREGLTVNSSWSNGSTSQIQSLLNNIDVKYLIIDSDIILTGNITVPSGKFVEFGYGNKISGAYTITLNGQISAPMDVQIFDVATNLTIPNNTVTNQSVISIMWWGAVGDGVTNSTTAAQKAATATNNNLELYIPRGHFLADDLFIRSNVRGAGIGSSYLEAYTNGHWAVLLGNTQASVTFGRNSFKDIQILGDFGAKSGIKLSNNGSSDQLAGKYRFENVHFHTCDTSFFKPAGNIGNQFENCVFLGSGTKYHYYATENISPVMHTGSDLFVNCRFVGADRAAIFINQTQNGGQHRFQNCIIESNDGFAIFIKNYQNATNPFVFDECYQEYNGRLNDTVSIDGDNYMVDASFYFNNAQTIFFRNTALAKMKLFNGTQVMAEGVNEYLDDGVITKDSTSQIFSAFANGFRINEQNILHLTPPFLSTSAIFRYPLYSSVSPIRPNTTYSNSFKNSPTLNSVADTFAVNASDGIVYKSCWEIQSGSSVTKQLTPTTSVSGGKYYVVGLGVKWISGVDTPSIGLVNELAATFKVSGNQKGEWVYYYSIAYVQNSGNTYLRIGRNQSVYRISGFQIMEFLDVTSALDFVYQKVFCSDDQPFDPTLQTVTNVGSSTTNDITTRQINASSQSGTILSSASLGGSGSGIGGVGYNVKFTTTNFQYRYANSFSDRAGILLFESGGMQFKNSVTGVAPNVITFTDRFIVSVAGLLRAPAYGLGPIQSDASGNFTSSGLSTGSNTDSVVTIVNGVLKKVLQSSIGGNNFYTADGSFSGNRVATMGSNNVTFSGVGDFNKYGGVFRTSDATTLSNGVRGIKLSSNNLTGQFHNGTQWLDDSLAIGSTGEGLLLQGNTYIAPLFGVNNRIMYAGPGGEVLANVPLTGTGARPVVAKADGTLDVIAAGVTVSSASTLSLSYGGDYFFTGTTATYTLPAISGTSTGRIYMITLKNRGSGNITVNTAAAGNDIYDTAAVNTITVLPGESRIFMPDGTYLNIE